MPPSYKERNNTDVVRWSLDLRYQDASLPNNVGELPGDFDDERGAAEIACFPPEADFVIRSPSEPAAECRSAAEFDIIRQRYEVNRPSGPDRGWSPYDQRHTS